MATKVPSDLSKLDDKRLQALWNTVAKEAAESKEDSRRIAHEVDRRLTAKSAQDRYDAMSDTERAALAQVFGAKGIESKESVSNG